MPSRFVTIKLFSQLTGLPDKTIRTAMKEGRLKGVPFGKRKMIDTQHFEESMENVLRECAFIQPDKSSMTTKTMIEKHRHNLKLMKEQTSVLSLTRAMTIVNRKSGGIFT